MGLFDDLLDDDHGRRGCSDRHGRDLRHSHGGHDDFGDGRNGHRNDRDHDDHDRRGHGFDPLGAHGLERKARALLANKAFLIAAVVMVLLVIAAVVAFVLPLLGHALDFVDQNGVKGVVEGAQGAVDRVWEGAGALPAEAGSKAQ